MKRVWLAPVALMLTLGVVGCHPVSEEEYQELRTVVAANNAYQRELHDWLVTVKKTINEISPPADVKDPPGKPDPWPPGP